MSAITPEDLDRATTIARRHGLRCHLGNVHHYGNGLYGWHVGEKSTASFSVTPLAEGEIDQEKIGATIEAMREDFRAAGLELEDHEQDEAHTRSILFTKTERNL